MRNSLMILCLCFVSLNLYAFTRGIYITQSTVENTKKLNWLISQSKKYGINTFIIDINRRSGHRYERNVKQVLDHGLRYVARIVVFPHGGTHAQVNNQKIWAAKLALAKKAISFGANAIQLDYIRYQAGPPATIAKAENIKTVVAYFKRELAAYHVPLQMDIFGIAAEKPAYTIGQDAKLLSGVVDAFCPMVYPSHYEPYMRHAVHPYRTVYTSIAKLKQQLKDDHTDTHVYAYIELYNYRYKLSAASKLNYIAAEIKGAKAGGANGYYVWSPNNHYAPLFQVLAQR